MHCDKINAEDIKKGDSRDMIKKTEKHFLQYIKKMTAFQEALSLIFWDLRTGAPKQGVEQRSEVIGVLSGEIFQMSISETMAAFIAKLSNQEAQQQLSDIARKSLAECKKEYNRNRKIPTDEYKEYVILQSKAENIWEEARATNNFTLFQPYLEELVETSKRFIEYWGYQDHKYDTLLDRFEPGVTVQMLDRVFDELKSAIIPLVKEISESRSEPETSFLYEHFPKENQRDFSMEILKQMGYRLEAGRLDETVHPFAIGLNPNDVRVTTRYDENDFRTAVFGTIHEGGHALYEQNIATNLIGTPLCRGTSYGIHESQSLFYENFVGRNLSFWEKNYPLLKRYAPEQFNQIELYDFYRAINEARPSLIRIEADELTYALHVIIRYEIEKSLFNDEIAVKDLPQIWNDKYEKYLGIRPANDGEGVLQDVHWAGGSFGYFPSYALGYMYAAQFKQAMLKDIPHFDDLLSTGDLRPLQQWFTEHVHQYGKTKQPLEILQDATGEGLNASYLIQYLTDKYRKVYELS